jgi:hypothetical protein
MEVKFDNGKHKIVNPTTQVYRPVRRGDKRIVSEDTPIPVRTHPEEASPTVSLLRSEVRLSDLSKVMVLISVFLIALTALLSLFGSAEYARITANIATIESDIESYQQQISQVKKTQSSMNDYRSIYDACVERGMQMVWEPDLNNGNP